MDDSNGMLVSLDAVPDDQFVSNDQGAAGVQIDERIGTVITERVKVLVGRFLDTQSHDSVGLTVDFVKSISFKDLVKYLRKTEVIAAAKDMLQAIHEFLRNSNIDVQYFLGQHDFKIRVFLAAYMIAVCPGHVFASMGATETRLTTSSIALLTNLEAILDHIWISTNLNTVSCALIDEFPRLIANYFEDFRAWKVPDNVRLKGVILDSLRSLYAESRNLSVADEEALGITRVDFEEQIGSLRVKLLAIGGQAELDEFDAAPLPPATVVPAPYLTNEQLLQNASRIIRGAAFTNFGTRNVSNMQIAHELLIDPSFQFEDNCSLSGKVGITNQSFVTVFWDDLLDGLKQPEPRYTGVFHVFEYVLNGIRDVAENSHALSLESLTVINIDHIKTSRQLEVWSSCVDLFTNISNLIIRAQTQEREDETKAKWGVLKTIMLEAQPEEQPQAMCDVCRFFSESIKVMRTDASNTRLGLIAGIISTHGISYEQNKFQEDLDCGTLTLENTTEWLFNEIREIKVKQLKELVSGNAEALRAVHHTALVNLIINPTQAGKIPEVFNLDLHRIAYFSKQYQKLVNCATAMRVINAFVSSEWMEDSQSSAVLESISHMVLANDPRKVEDIELLIDIILQTPLQHGISSDNVKAMRIELGRIFSDPYYDILTTVSKRIENYWKQFNVLQADTEPLHSVYAVSSLITDEARRLSAFVALNIKIHLPVFTRVIVQVAKEVVMPTGSLDEMQSID